VAFEPVDFAQDEINTIRNEVDQAFSQTPVNLNQCLSKQSLLIAVYLQFLKQNFEWKCNSGPSTSSLTCSTWALEVES